jgi:hypothetical protein
MVHMQTYTGSVCSVEVHSDEESNTSLRRGSNPARSDKTVHGEASWGQGERGAAGYEDSGGSELIYLGEELGVIGGGTEG